MVASRLSVTLIAAFFRSRADPARLSCVLALQEWPRTVGEIVTETKLSQPNVSRHLARLHDCSLVSSERSGRFVTYRLPVVGGCACPIRSTLEGNG